MGRVRRGGYVITWFISDHEPRHVHVETDKGRLVGRLNLRTRLGMEGWHPDRRLLGVIEQLEREGRL
jgi:hypothetical protein